MQKRRGEQEKVNMDGLSCTDYARTRAQTVQPASPAQLSRR